MSETERVTLVGNLTANPELRSTPTGLEVANLRLAVTPRTRQDDGTWTQGETSFHTITVWRDQATHAMETLNRPGFGGDSGGWVQATAAWPSWR
jgi:single-strand DNA-binding protein